MPANFDGFLWLILALGPLVILQRNLHREVQWVFLLITRRLDIAVMLFSLIFFPGVLLHEGSHYLTARLVGVRTGKFSIIPRPLDRSRLQLGYVETAHSDWIRDALIGMAPLITGGLFVAYTGVLQLKLPELAQVLWTGGVDAFSPLIDALVSRPDFWLWIYLALVVSSTMLPSESDRRAWLPLGLVLGGTLGLSLVLGAGPWLAENAALPFNRMLRAIASVFGISAFLHAALLPFVWLARRILSRLTGLDVVI